MIVAPLARLIAQAAKRSQIMVVSHASALIADLETAAEVTRIVLEKHLGETRVQADEMISWTRPSR
jgi:predicted ATPase